MLLLQSLSSKNAQRHFTRSKQTLSLQSSQRLKACPADPDSTFFGLHSPTPPTDSRIHWVDPSLKETLKEKTWHLYWMPMVFLAIFWPQRQPTHFICEICVKHFRSFAKRFGHSSHFCVLMLSHARNVLARILCSISTGITCSLVKRTLDSHDHVMNASAQLARNSGLRVRVIRKVAATAAHNNKQGDVQAM